MKTAKINVTVTISRIEYICPHCNNLIDYLTDDLPKSECHRCLAPFKSEYHFAGKEFLPATISLKGERRRIIEQIREEERERFIKNKHLCKK